MAIYPGPNQSKWEPKSQIFPYSLRDIKVERPNQVWGIDITYIRLLKDTDVKINLDGKGCAADNIFTEQFWRNLKYEEVYLKDYVSPREARAGITNYIGYYNFARPHMSLYYGIPAFKGKSICPEVTGINSLASRGLPFQNSQLNVELSESLRNLKETFSPILQEWGAFPA